MSTVAERVLRVIAEQLGYALSDITADSRKDDLGMDSLDDIETVMALEDEFEILVPDDVSEGWTTAKDAITYFEERAK